MGLGEKNGDCVSNLCISLRLFQSKSVKSHIKIYAKDKTGKNANHMIVKELHPQHKARLQIVLEQHEYPDGKKNDKM